jgi:hypothetical protein
MANLRPNDDHRNPLAELLADAIALAVTRPEVILALRAVYTRLHVEPEPGGLVAPAKAAKALDVSLSTLNRLTTEGAPHHTIGGRRRYDIGELVAWSNARGQRPANAKPKTDNVDVEDVLARSGLRVAGSR